MSVVPEAGDIVLLNLDPTIGTEQAGVRPCLVLSARLMQSFSKRVIVCPITSNVSPWPTKVFLPEGLRVMGAVLIDQIRAVDREARMLRIMDKVPEATLAEARDILATLCGINLAEDKI